MKIAIVGSSGYIGSALIKRLDEEKAIDVILKIGRNPEADIYLDLRRPEKFDYMCLSNIDLVIFAAAVSSPDKCASNFNDCWQVNVCGTSYFIRKSIEYGCKVLFLSSDAVFGEGTNYIYTENSETRAATPYGKMKKAVEDEFISELLFKTLRLPYIVSAKDRFITYCLECIRNDESAEIFHPFYRNCIVISDVLEVLVWLLYHYDRYTPASLNIAGSELISRVRIADELNRVLNGRLKYRVVLGPNEFFKNRPVITQMKSLYLTAYDILDNSTFSEKIQKELERIET